jgi:hypothetical protein
MTSYCGINCEECEAFSATQNNDNQLKKRVAQRWSSLYGKEFKPEDVHCEGCRSEGTLGTYCQAMCRIKPCCREKQIETCAQCREFACKDLKEVFDFCSEARERLMALKKS